MTSDANMLELISLGSNLCQTWPLLFLSVLVEIVKCWHLEAYQEHFVKPEYKAHIGVPHYRFLDAGAGLRTDPCIESPTLRTNAGLQKGIVRLRALASNPTAPKGPS